MITGTTLLDQLEGRNVMSGAEARAIRTHLGKSAREMAEIMGLNPSSIYRWEWRTLDAVPRYYAVALRGVLAARGT